MEVATTTVRSWSTSQMKHWRYSCLRKKTRTIFVEKSNIVKNVLSLPMCGTALRSMLKCSILELQLRTRDREPKWQSMRLLLFIWCSVYEFSYSKLCIWSANMEQGSKAFTKNKQIMSDETYLCLFLLLQHTFLTRNTGYMFLPKSSFAVIPYSAAGKFACESRLCVSWQFSSVCRDCFSSYDTDSHSIKPSATRSVGRW